MKKVRERKISWITHLIELVVVFIGISLAFTLDNWREYRNHQEMKEQYLNSFLSDISDDANSLKDLIRYNIEKEKRVIKFIGRLKNENADFDSVIVIMGDLMTTTPFSAKLTTYESIKSSGNLNLLTNHELKQMIIGYYQILGENSMKEEMYHNYINNFAIPYVYENMDFLRQKVTNKNILGQKHFQNLIIGYQTLLSQNIQMYQSLYNTNEQLQKVIQSTLNQ